MSQVNTQKREKPQQTHIKPIQDFAILKVNSSVGGEGNQETGHFLELKRITRTLLAFAVHSCLSVHVGVRMWIVSHTTNTKPPRGRFGDSPKRRTPGYQGPLTIGDSKSERALGSGGPYTFGDSPNLRTPWSWSLFAQKKCPRKNSSGKIGTKDSISGFSWQTFWWR